MPPQAPTTRKGSWQNGFCASDAITAKLVFGDPWFVNQPGILVGTEFDPRTGLALEINTTLDPDGPVLHDAMVWLLWR